MSRRPKIWPSCFRSTPAWHKDREAVLDVRTIVDPVVRNLLAALPHPQNAFSAGKLAQIDNCVDGKQILMSDTITGTATNMCATNVNFCVDLGKFGWYNHHHYCTANHEIRCCAVKKGGEPGRWSLRAGHLFPLFLPVSKAIMGAQRIRKVKSREEMDEMVDDFITQGYKVVSDGKSSVQLKQSDWGSASMHIIILILLGCWTLGIANLIYALIVHSNAERVLVKLIGTKNDEDDNDD